MIEKEMMTYLPIIAGAILMIVNIVRYVGFLSNSNDVMSSGSNEFWKNINLVLLIFFFFGYIYVATFAEPNLVTSMILFFGSVFVALMLTLVIDLLSTAKEQALRIAEVLIGVIDTRDPNLDGHSHHVQKLTMTFYKYLPDRLKKGINPLSLEYAALMHDIGKLGIPESILNKPAKLDDEEWTIMRTHPQIGVKILEPLPSFVEIADWIMYHHERVDGKGYYGIKEKDIPLVAKILAIADTYSAITMRRSYKESRTHEDAIRIIKEVEGSQLDKELSEIFIQIPKEELLACMPEDIR